MDRVTLRPTHWLFVSVGLGLVLRTYHYLSKPAVWQDEGALIINVIRLPFDRLFGPLLLIQAAPPLFLVVERAVVLVLGDGEYALRLFPFLASCLALILFADLVRRVLPPWPALLATVLLAFSDRLLWHCCEVKPYAVDVFVPILLAYCYVRTEGWPLVRRCFPAALALPVVLWMSFPSSFVIGGLLVALLPALRAATWLDRASYALVVASVGAAFVALALGPVKAQHNPELAAFWVSHFPDWERPWSVPLWAIVSTFEVGRYNFLPLGQVVIPFAAWGGWAMIRRGEGRQVAVAVLPLGLALVAALVHRYPYGSSRLEVFAAPGLAWLAAEGAAQILPRVWKRSRILAGILLVLLLLPVPLTLYRTVVHWPRPASDVASAYVLEHRQPHDHIVFNHWEYEYYLRNTEHGRFWLGSFEPTDIPPQHDATIWVVHTNPQNVVEHFPFPLPAGWHVVEMTSFPSTRVFRLRRIDSSGGS